MDELVELFKETFNLGDEYENLIYNLNLINTETNIYNLISILHNKNQFYYKNILFEENIKEQQIIKQQLEECLNINFINNPILYIHETKILLNHIIKYVDSKI